MHSSRMLTAHLFTISRRIPCISGGSLTNPPCSQTLEVCSLSPSPHMQILLDADLLDADLLDADPIDSDPLVAEPYGHVTCDVCWEANPTADRKTPVKTLPCPKLRLREVNIVRYLWFLRDAINFTIYMQRCYVCAEMATKAKSGNLLGLH